MSYLHDLISEDVHLRILERKRKKTAFLKDLNQIDESDVEKLQALTHKMYDAFQNNKLELDAQKPDFFYNLRNLMIRDPFSSPIVDIFDKNYYHKRMAESVSGFLNGVEHYATKFLVAKRKVAVANGDLSMLSQNDLDVLAVNVTDIKKHMNEIFSLFKDNDLKTTLLDEGNHLLDGPLSEFSRKHARKVRRDLSRMRAGLSRSPSRSSCGTGGGCGGGCGGCGGGCGG